MIRETIDPKTVIISLGLAKVGFIRLTIIQSVLRIIISLTEHFQGESRERERKRLIPKITYIRFAYVDILLSSALLGKTKVSLL